MPTAIKVENLSKAYQIGQIGTGTISRDIERWWITKVMRGEDPFLKLGETNDRSTKGKSDIVWSLKDINLEIEQGDAVGIIGRNGAGKSTLLKILSRVTSPTTGHVKIKGRVASLLEVGTGFHPELSGRENIYLNGSILGMRKREIDRKLDEIVDFSGVERYIDTPVKRYSSGMSVRLAFAVAAHLESEILLVDEVLAVGDAEFQKKCLGKMEEVGQREGRTILFVSHNMSAVQSLCSKGIQIDQGIKAFDGVINECLANYSHTEVPIADLHSRRSVHLGNLLLNGQRSPKIYNDEPVSISVELQSQELEGAILFFIIENSFGQNVIHVTTTGAELGHEKLHGSYTLSIDVPPLWLSAGPYTVYSKIIGRSSGRNANGQSERLLLEVAGDVDRTGRTLLQPGAEWRISRPVKQRDTELANRKARLAAVKSR